MSSRGSYIGLHFQVLLYLLSGEHLKKDVEREFMATGTNANTWLRAAVSLKYVEKVWCGPSGRQGHHGHYKYVPLVKVVPVQG